MSRGEPTDVHLRPLMAGDVSLIHQWPAYEGAFAPLDYALRPGGWLDAFPESATTRRFGIWLDARLAGFVLLTDIHDGDAELYIAIHPQETGRGAGGAAILQLLDFAFGSLGLDAVHLKVRVWHTHAQALYARLGFVVSGELTEVIRGRPEPFVKMRVKRPATPATSG